ncbi:MAG: AraC family transcriptional regulator [Idiomarinaceae bacterium HL-53]|nr:MAG: AraC family transcriptional regulator [Idiomarinaceae bacterium HL-53]CUS47952.1 transcriptional regulator, AraC family [Idiomarinaceae bacterium HL-53]
MTNTPKQSTEAPNELEGLIAQLAFGASLHFQSGLCKGWALKAESSGKPALHILSYGQAWLTVPGEHQRVKLQAGDAIFFARSVTHWLSSEASDSALETGKFKPYCTPEKGDQGLVCYDIEVNDTVTETVFQTLPDWCVIPAAEQGGSLRAVVELIEQESEAKRPGFETAISRMSDVVVLQVLRNVIANENAQQGILAALKDPQLKQVVLAIIDNPAGNWKVESMAAKAFLSRSAFADRVHNKTGMSPKSLLNALRLQRARFLLHQQKLPIELIAEQVGYASATSFIRFFKQELGVSPGEYIKRIRGD